MLCKEARHQIKNYSFPPCLDVGGVEVVYVQHGVSLLLRDQVFLSSVTMELGGVYSDAVLSENLGHES